MPRFLLSAGDDVPSAPPPPQSLDSDVVVILAALLCALICVVGLALVARCAWLRRSSASGGDPQRQVPSDRGLKKKALRSLPKCSFNGAVNEKLTDCVICLTEFADGDEIRVLPLCGHGFHVSCVDAWLGAHSSCPSCRRSLLADRCQMCGRFPATEGEAKAREDDGNRFLP